MLLPAAKRFLLFPYWQVPGYKRGPGRPRANWRSTVNKDLQKMGFTWEEAEVAALDRYTDGVGVWPNVSSWIQDESRSRVNGRMASNMLPKKLETTTTTKTVIISKTIML